MDLLSLCFTANHYGRYFTIRHLVLFQYLTQLRLTRVALLDEGQTNPNLIDHDTKLRHEMETVKHADSKSG